MNPEQPQETPQALPEQPFTTQAQSPPAPAVAATAHSNAGLIILQWLTYAFWGWTVLALSVLTTTVVASFINGADTGSFTPYGIAAVLVLLPISYACDHFYSKREPEKKVGPEIIVMVIHAVIFALFAIGSLIVGVIALVQMFVSSTDSKGALVTLCSAMIIAVYYVLTFLRTLNPAIIRWVQRYYRIIMLISVGIIALLGIIGPVAQERTTRNDRLIESALPDVQAAINNYAQDNNRLPDNLNAIKTKNDSNTQQLLNSNLVTYKPQGSTVTVQPSTNTLRNTALSRSKPVYKYELCVTYKKESKGYNRYRSGSYRDLNDDYNTYLSAYSHPAGETCYKLQTTDY